jgi:hypothetical protein
MEGMHVELREAGLLNLVRNPAYTTVFDDRELFVVEAALKHFELARDPQAPWGIEEDIERIRKKLFHRGPEASLLGSDMESETNALPWFTVTTTFFREECAILREALTQYQAHCREELRRRAEATFPTLDECIESARKKIPRFVAHKVSNEPGEEKYVHFPTLEDPR